MSHHLYGLMGSIPEHGQVVADALAGDEVALMATLDLIQERGESVTPFVVGECYFIQTLTLYFVGRVVEVSPCWVRLDRASWVHRTGRLSTMARVKSFDRRHFHAADLKPRTEYVGEWTLSLGSIVGLGPWTEEGLPTESIQ